MLIKIDNRETRLLEQIHKLKELNVDEYNEINIVEEKLDLGDIIIYDETQEKELLIIERKSVPDLASSIKDGRYSEQSFRLLNTDLHNHNIIYLIEGNLMDYKEIHPYCRYKHPIHINTLYSSIVSLGIFKGFSVFKTNDLYETALYILRLTFKINKEKKPFYYINGKNNSPLTIEPSVSSTDYCNVVKRTKKDNITNNNIGVIMLMQIPQVSFKSANAVMNKFNFNFKKLLDTMDTDKNCLDDVTYISNTKLGDKEKKIGKNVITSIFTYLLPNNYIKI
jgi:ERCC4-type nuclease